MKKIFNRLLSNPIFSSVVFATLPSLSIYEHNINETFITIALRAITVSVIFGLLSWLVFFFLFAKNTKKAGIFTSVWLLEFFSYGHVYLFLTDQKINNLFPVGFHAVLIGAYFLVLLAVFFILIKTDSQNTAMRVFSFVALTILVLNLINILPKETSKIIGLSKLNKYTQSHQESLNFSNTDPSTYPDIYYFIFDRYANGEILKKYLNYDNDLFLADLEDKGFFIGKNSFANYPATFLSLSSSLNFQHMSFLSDVLGTDYSDQSVVYKSFIESNRLTDFLKSVGYEYTHIGSSWRPTSSNPKADQNINKFIDFNEFELYLYENTILNVLAGKIGGTQIFSGVENLQLKTQNLSYRVNGLKSLSSSEKPRYVFGHFLLPHPPYLLSPECEPIPFETVRITLAEKGYLDQLGCANKTISEIIESINRTSTRPSVIVIQSDEGPFVPTNYFIGDKYPSGNPGESFKIHGHILNALYIPEKNNPSQPVDYESLGFNSQSSSVNTFRFILNYYFGTELPALDDKSYVFKDSKHPYDFTEITSELLPSN